MKIVICDDSIEDLMKIERFLHRYAESCADTQIDIEKFSDPSRLYDRICSKDFADIYILDMLMPEKTGIDLGSLLQRSAEESVIIYATASDDFALEAYRVHAVRYLLKPIREEDLFEALDYAFAGRSGKKEAIYLLKTKAGSISVPYSKIEYIENVSRMLELHLTDGETAKSIFIRKSFDAEMAGLLEQEQFLQVHKSFVINLKHVRKIVQNDVIMESGRSVPVSKARIAGVKKAYLLFVSEQYR